MIRHVVIFKCKPGVAKEDPRVKEGMSAMTHLSGIIPVIKAFSLGPNLTDRPIAYDYGMVVDFDSLADLQTYILHSDHQAAVAILKEVCDWNVCDYEI